MNKYIEEVLKLADKAYKNDDVPVGAIVVLNDKIIGKGYNKKNKTKSVIDHAEIIAIRQGAKNIGDWRLDNCVLYVTLEPCNMCKEVIKQSRIKKVIYLVNSSFYNESQRKIIYDNIDDIDHQLIEKYKEKLSEFFKHKR